MGECCRVRKIHGLLIFMSSCHVVDKLGRFQLLYRINIMYGSFFIPTPPISSSVYLVYEEEEAVSRSGLAQEQSQ